MTLQKAEEFRDAAEAAYLKGFGASNYNINTGGGASRALSRQALNDLHDKYLYWEGVVDKLKSGAPLRSIKFGTSND